MLLHTGAYDNGVIRVWSVQSYSLVTLKGLLSRHLNAGKWSAGTNSYDLAANTGAPLGSRIASSLMSSSFGMGTMAISPITLLHQWQAHSSPFISSNECNTKLLYIIWCLSATLFVAVILP